LTSQSCDIIMGFEELWDGFEKVCDKTEKGEEFTKTMIKYFEKRLEIEQKYSKSLAAMNSIFNPEREDATTKDCWSSLRDETTQLAKDREVFSVDLAKLIEEIKAQLNIDKKNRLDLWAKGKKLVKDLKNTTDLMDEARKKYVTARKTQQASDEQYKKFKVQNQPAKVDKAEKQLKKDKEKANSADEEYRKAVVTLARHQDKYYQEDMPALLKEFESFERTRIIYTKKTMNVFVGLQAKLGPEWQNSTDKFRRKVESIDPKTDLDTFVSANRPEQSQPPARAQYMSWDGTLIEDLGPRRENPTKVNTNTTNSSPSNVGKATNFTPRDDSVVVSSPVISTPISQPVYNSQPSFTQPVQQSAAGSGRNLVALFSYDATEENELTFVEGDFITLIEENESGWWKGRLNSTGVEGLFPSNFVEENAGAAQPVASAVKLSSSEIKAEYIALYDYDAEDNTEISIKENDLLYVESETDGWFYGYRKAEPGKKGNFPSNFVERKS